MIVLLWACGGPTEVGEPPTPELLQGPVVHHVPPDRPISDGDLVLLEASAIDEDGLDGMELRYRPTGELFYERLEMQRLPSEDPTMATFTVSITASAPGVDYLFRAFDDSDFRIAGTFPLEAESSPLRLVVEGIPVVAPFYESFDAEVTYGLFDIGWNEVALRFRGRRWEHSTQEFHGTHSARHREGFEGMDPTDDWLVAPTLDLGGLVTAEVRWMEWGEFTEHAEHGLWISTGSADPESGDFVEVVSLAAPEETRWTQAPVVDLTEWAGQSQVTLAWRYEAEGVSDRWIIDDVRVREFAPDLQLVDVGVGRADPGTSTLVEVRLENLGAPTPGDVTLLGIDGGELTWSGPVDLGPLGTGDQSSGMLLFELSPDQPDNTVLQTSLQATDGTEVFAWPLAVQVGDPTAGLVRLQTLDSGLVQVWVGVGDPRAPVFEEPVFQGQLLPGIYTLATDLAVYNAWLPSAAGRERWWAKIHAESDSFLLGFGLNFDGEVVWSDDHGQTPAGAEGVFYLPARARPVIDALVPDPSPLAPGRSGLIQLTLRNRGGPTVGQTEVRFSADPALGLGVDTVRLPRNWTEPVVLELPVAVDAQHIHSVPLALELVVVDDGEAYTASTSIPVPWPKLSFGPPQVADPTGNNNGVLDPDEEVGLTLAVQNTGALATQPLTCQPTQVQGPTAVITSSASVAALDPGVDRALNLILTATGATDGDTLDFQLVCTDGIGSWTGSFTLSVGGPPWIPVGTDPLGDAFDGASLDLRQARFRVDGDQLELEFTGTGAVDPNTLHYEVWSASPGGFWRNIVLTVDAGEATLWGVQSGGWTPLPDPTLSVSGPTVRIGLPISELSLSDNLLRVAVGTGFCGIPELYCDHWPDGWGNPYASAPNSTHWIEITW